MFQCWKDKPKSRPSAIPIIKLIQSSAIIQYFEATNTGLNDRVYFLQSMIHDVVIVVKN